MTELRTIEGAWGRAEELLIVDSPAYAATVQHWLITAPHFHPAWSQYSMAVVRLEDLPGFPPAVKQTEDMTHELTVVALNPEHGMQTRSTMGRYADESSPFFKQLPFLLPVNIAAQVQATDKQAADLLPFIAKAVVVGGVTPETSDAPEIVRLYWQDMLDQGIAHMRGEHECGEHGVNGHAHE